MQNGEYPCENQDAFNKSLKQALKYKKKEDRPSYTLRVIYMIVHVVLAVWAIVLAMQIPSLSQAEKTEHLTLAIIFPPIYIIAYYLGME